MKYIDPQSSFEDWREKLLYLQKNIQGKLPNESLKDPFKVLIAFVMKTQLIDWEIKQLISHLNDHVRSQLSESPIKLKPRSPRQLSDERLTLGKLINELERFKDTDVDKIITDLRRLQKVRNTYVHNLFLPGSLADLVRDLRQAIKISDRVLIVMQKKNQRLINEWAKDQARYILSRPIDIRKLEHGPRA